MCCAILSLTQDFCNLLSQKVTSFRKFEVQFCEEDFSREFYCSDCRPREITTCKVLGLLSADNGAITALTKRTQNNNFKIYRYNFGDFTLQLASIHRCSFAVFGLKIQMRHFWSFSNNVNCVAALQFQNTSSFCLCVENERVINELNHHKSSYYINYHFHGFQRRRWMLWCSWRVCHSDFLTICFFVNIPYFYSYNHSMRSRPRGKYLLYNHFSWFSKESQSK